ncbi:family 1 glycosylhydrolase [Microbacterium rhizosphaerae]|uniref:Family 1 glycosylhydrolase n=1 Tax=Microbacterium rhizosphaerae TaxID=1678237 RepID=A0ABZ0SR41_9MICO|nr:family 1 glycosylhydrolase [Microbacterium rhizosphaerae]WPR89791.1 family 1 glycosylhydrolase [Microbacterium rhizosphaerae]
MTATDDTGTANRWFADGALHLGLGIEDTFVPQGGPGARPIDEYELTEHYVRWREDIDLAADVGAEFLRWGIPWHRVNPAPGEWDWDWTDRVLGRMSEHGIRPVVDLLHYGTPLWLERQFAHPDYSRRVAEYAVAVAERYGDAVTDYTPVNEPMIHVLFCGEYGYWPPYLTGQEGATRLAMAIADGFARTQHGIRDVLGERAVFVHVDASMRYVGDVEAAEHRETAARLRHQAFLVEDLVTGRVDDRHPLAAMLLSNGADPALLGEFIRNPARPDVMGVNYYPRHSTEVFEAGVHHAGGFADPRPTRDDGVAGLREMIDEYARRYGAPVMVTETCVTGSAEERIGWLRESVDEVARMRRSGTPVVGYTWWPLFDMYEWTYRHGTGPRAEHLLTMGLFDLVESAEGLRRERTPVADAFHALARASQRAVATPS